jgi:hypothetical protein
VAAAFHVSVAVELVASDEPVAGNKLLTQAGGTCAVVKVVKFALQPVDAPAIFFGTIYQLYSVAGVNPDAL